MFEEVASAIVQLAGLAVCIIFTLVFRKKTICILAGILIMFIANFIGQGVIMGGGPGLFAGAFLSPILGGLSAWTTIILANRFIRKRDTCKNTSKGNKCKQR